MRIHKKLVVRSIALATLGLALSPMFIGPRAGASMVTECQSMISALHVETETVVIVKNEDRNRSMLLSRLENASDSLTKGKFCDTIGKLEGYIERVGALADAGTLNTDLTVGVSAQELMNGASRAIVCIEFFATQSGATCTTSSQ
jgi:hypothetical protein